MASLYTDSDTDAKVWKNYEEDQMVAWFHRVCTNWNPDGTKAILKIVRTYHDMIKAMSPFLQRQFSMAEIVMKLMTLKDEYDNFAWLLNNKGMRIVGREGPSTSGFDFVFAMAIDETRGSDRITMAGLKNYNMVRDLFDAVVDPVAGGVAGGWLSKVDYTWLKNAVNGANPAWLGKPAF